RPGEPPPVRGVHDDRVRWSLDRLVEPQRDLRRRRVHLALLRGVRLFHRGVGRRGRGHGEREEDGGDDGTPSHGLPPASSERCPKIDATSRSENSITATATNVSANPYDHSARRGRSAAPTGNTEATTSVQPIRWWRNAERANSQPFCSCTRNEAPEMNSAPAVTSDQYCEWSLPRTRASSTAPAAVAACAQIECATRCSVEKVEKTAMSHSQTPAKSASDGQRYARHGRLRKTACPTIASASSTSPKKRKPAANSQCAISARGSISACLVRHFQVLDEPGGDEEREEEADQHDEERRLDSPVPEPLAVGIEEGDAIRLRERPDDAAEDRQRPERLDRDHAKRLARGTRPAGGFRPGCDELVHDRGCLHAQSAQPDRPSATGNVREPVSPRRALSATGSRRTRSSHPARRSPAGRAS